MNNAPAATVLRMCRLFDVDIATPEWPANIQVTSFIPDQAKEAYNIMQQAYTNGYGHLSAFEEWLHTTTHDEEFDASLCFIVTTSNGIIAFAQCWTSGFIKDFTVSPATQGQGIGYTLLLHVLQTFKQKGYTQVELKVRAANTAAIKLYEKCGFAVVEEIRV